MFLLSCRICLFEPGTRRLAATNFWAEHVNFSFYLSHTAIFPGTQQSWIWRSVWRSRHETGAHFQKERSERAPFVMLTNALPLFSCPGPFLSYAGLKEMYVCLFVFSFLNELGLLKESWPGINTGALGWLCSLLISVTSKRPLLSPFRDSE